MSLNNNDYNKLGKLISNIEKDLRQVKYYIQQIEDANKKSYKEIPGVMGVFDGFYMTTETGEKYEVPLNYAAKSRLVFGDTLKMIEEDGKQLYKQVAKVPRKRIEGVINKKEGKWYILAENGSYRLNDKAVEFNKLELNDKTIALIPEDNPSAAFAALDKESEESAERSGPRRPDVNRSVADRPHTVATSEAVIKAPSAPAPKKTITKVSTPKVKGGPSKATETPSPASKPVTKSRTRKLEVTAGEAKEFVDRIGDIDLKSMAEGKPSTDAANPVLDDDDLR